MGVYDPDVPVRPTPEGSFIYEGRSFIAGALYAREAVEHLVDVYPVLAADIETVGLGVLGFSIKVVTIGAAGEVVALDPRDPAQAECIRWAFANIRGHIVFHNSSFDVPSLVANNLMRIADIDKVVDTMIYARMAAPGTFVSKELTDCVKRWLGIDFDADNTIVRAFKAAGYRNKQDGYALMDIDSPVYLRSAMLDTALTFELLGPVWQAAYTQTTEGHPFEDVGVRGDEAAALIEREQIVNRVMLRRSARGMPVDLDFLATYQREHEDHIEQIGDELTALGVTPGNGNHLTRYLDGLGAIPAGYPRTKKTGAISAQAKHLETLDHEIARKFVDHKQQVKIGTYLTQVETFARATGRVHPQCNVLGASATGRMSYSNPPFQQFPGGARPMVLAEHGRELTSIDWSSIEPTVMANAAGEWPMITEYEGGGDLYAPVVAATGVERKVSKTILLGQMYGQGVPLMASIIKRPQDETREIRAAVMGAMPEIKKYLHKLKTIGEQHGKMVTISGRVLDVEREFGYRAQNYWCQGSAYDMLAEAIVAVERAGLGEFIVLAMHDELVLDGEPAAIRELMQVPPPRLVAWVDRTPLLRTDLAVCGRAWAKV